MLLEFGPLVNFSHPHLCTFNSRTESFFLPLLQGYFNDLGLERHLHSCTTILE